MITRRIIATISCVLLIFDVIHITSQHLLYTFRTKNEKKFELKLNQVKGSLKRIDPINAAIIGRVLEKQLVKNENSAASHFIHLFIRAKSKDYEFATYRDPCHLIPMQNLRHILNIYTKVFGNSEEQEQLAGVLAVQSTEENREDIIKNKLFREYLPELVNIFRKSRSICDFKKLLICNEKSKTCACLNGMVNLGGVCRILPGKKCNLVKSDLERMGVLVTKESRAAICVPDAQCVSLLQNSSHSTCKCRTDFAGENCRRERVKQLLKKNPLDGEQGLYSLYPDEIVKDLISLLEFRGIISFEERKRIALDIFKRSESDKIQEVILEHDVYLRRLAFLNYGDECDPQIQIKIDNPPLSTNGDGIWLNPDPKEILQWQLYVLNKSIPMCNNLKNLRCGLTSKVCECQEGLRFQSGKCRVSIGYSCASDYRGVFLFDPIQSTKRFSQPLSPECVIGASCTKKPLFLDKKCWCNDFTVCGDEFDENSLKTLHANISKSFDLSLGEKCDPNVQSLLMSPEDEQTNGYEHRMNIFREIANSKKRFCNVSKFYNCSEDTGLCQCWNSFTEQNGQCLIKNLGFCGHGFAYKTSLYRGGVTLWKLEQAFSKNFTPSCLQSASCGIDGNCACSNGKTGSNCSDDLSAFASILQPSTLSELGEDLSLQRKLFYELNTAMLKLEGIMTGELYTPCSFPLGKKLDIIIDFWKVVDLVQAGKMQNHLTAHRLLKLVSWIYNLFQRSVIKGSLCNTRRGFTCSRNKERGTDSCRCQKGSAFDGRSGVCKIVNKISCANDSFKAVTWIPQCHSSSICRPLTNQLLYTCACDPSDMDECEQGIATNYFDTFTFDEETQTKAIAMDNELNDMEELGSEQDHISDVTDGNGGNYEDDELVTEMWIYNANKKSYDQQNASTNGTGIIATNFSTILLNGNDTWKSIQQILSTLKVRKLDLGKPCNYKMHKIFTRLFPQHVVPKNFITLQNMSKSTVETYTELTSYISKDREIFLCDKLKYMECNAESSSCDCMHRHHLVRNEKECRLKANELCQEKISRGYLQCESGTKCTKSNFGPFKCQYTGKEESNRFSVSDLDKNSQALRPFQHFSGNLIFSTLLFSYF